MMKYLKVAFFPTLLIVGILMLHDAWAETNTLELARIVIIDGEGIVQDSYVVPPRAQGSLTVESDDRNIIRAMRFEAWFRGEEQPILSDWVLTLDYVPNGSEYEFMSLWTNEQYRVTFLRRAPPDEIFDPAIIMMFEMSNGATAYVDYRYR